MSFFVEHYESIISGTVAGIVAGVVVSLLSGAFRLCRTYRSRKKQIENIREILMYARESVLEPRNPDHRWENFNYQKDYLENTLENGSYDLHPQKIQSIRHIVNLTTLTRDYKQMFDRLEKLKWLKFPASGSKKHNEWRMSILQVFEG